MAARRACVMMVLRLIPPKGDGLLKDVQYCHDGGGNDYSHEQDEGNVSVHGVLRLCSSVRTDAILSGRRSRSIELFLSAAGC